MQKNNFIAIFIIIVLIGILFVGLVSKGILDMSSWGDFFDSVTSGNVSSGDVSSGEMASGVMQYQSINLLC